MIGGKHLSHMDFTPENPLISHMNNFSWESRLVSSVVDEAGDGRHEMFKSTQIYDGAVHRKQHGFAV